MITWSQQKNEAAIRHAKLAFDNLITAKTNEERLKARFWMLAWTMKANVHLLGNEAMRTR